MRSYRFSRGVYTSISVRYRGIELAKILYLYTIRGVIDKKRIEMRKKSHIRQKISKKKGLYRT